MPGYKKYERDGVRGTSRSGSSMITGDCFSSAIFALGEQGFGQKQ